jgi:hypothetical protein
VEVVGVDVEVAEVVAAVVVVAVVVVVEDVRGEDIYIYIGETLTIEWNIYMIL